MKEKKYYLAYGSNLNVRQMQMRCPGAKPVGTAEIKDYRLLFKGSKTGSYFTIEKAVGQTVPVGVWEVVDYHEHQLDRYEGFPTFYYKKEFDVLVDDWKRKKRIKRKAFAYVMHEDHLIGLPSMQYVRTCAEGYDDFGLDADYIVKAVEYSNDHCGMVS